MASHSTPRHLHPTSLKTILFGAPYYPEHWSADERKSDARRMADAGVNVVRMAEFAWDRIEPQPEQFDFSLFDETIAELAAHGIRTVLCTPTATPPRWLTAAHDDWMRLDADGRRMVHGSRQHCCTNNPEFREHSRRITTAMAEHYAQNEQVIGWQTDNELFCHISECYCDACRSAFRQWLRRKYGTTEKLNSAWGTAFWAQSYPSFDVVPLPYVPERPTYANPGHLLDYYRFISDAIREFQHEQVQILRHVGGHWWITHNGMMNHIDYWEFTRDLDFLGIDVYPGFSVTGPVDAYGPSLALERCRAASGGFVVPEQQAGAGGQRPFLHQTPRPGQMRLWAYQSIAHGADGVLHFRWRTCRFGAEIYWNGVLDHDDIPRRRYDEFAQEGRELARIGEHMAGTVAHIRIGVLTEQDQQEAHRTIPMGLQGPRQSGDTILCELLRRHLPAGFVDARDSFEGLQMIIVPSFELIDSELASRLRRFVRDGGTLVATARTATRDRDNRVLAHTPPGPLAGVFGLTVEEFGKLDTPLLQLQAGVYNIPAGNAYEILNLQTAQPLAVWGVAEDGGPHAAPMRPAAAMNVLGDGRAVYVGTYVTDENAHLLADLLLKQVSITSLGLADEYVEITCREAADRTLFFVLNHYPEHKSARGLPEGTELISGEHCGGVVELEPYGVAIVRTR
ncbi:MAG: cellulase family glycosylhydrolase [Chitinivibrionales bacterium]|nr:cellulase family glycosylhydrolase [Chitinivibrionales bacterium]